MGKELVTTVRIGQEAGECRVLLEADELICRGEPKRRFLHAKMADLAVADGWLEFRYEGQHVQVQLGEQASAWLEAIRNPRTRMQKLGVSAGTSVCVLGDAEPDAIAELTTTLGAAPARRLRKPTDVVLCFASEHADLERLTRIEPLLAEGGAVWALWPKGRHDFTHDHVVTAARAAGLTQTRSIGFSAKFSGLRLVRPAAKKAARRNAR